MSGAHAELLDILGLLDPMEASEAELEALEREPQRPIKKETRKRDSGKPRDELGRFTKAKKRK